MRTIALRFTDRFAPKEGTIIAHQHIIDEYGFVWYGKMGTAVSNTVINEIERENNAKILLIHSGKTDRYWACIDKIQREKPDQKFIPAYYRENNDNFKTWFRIICFEMAPRDILSKCIVPSSGNTLSYTSRHSMSPYYIIEYNENDEESLT